MIAKCLKKGMSGVALASMIAFFSMQTQAYQTEEERFNYNSDIFIPKTALELAASSSDGIADYKYNLRQNDPNASRKRDLAVEAERKARILAGEAEARKQRLDGYRANIKNKEALAELEKKEAILASLTGEERLNNYLRRLQGDQNTIDDFYFKYDIENKDNQYLEAKYGKEVADYARKSQKGIFKW